MVKSIFLFALLFVSALCQSNTLYIRFVHGVQNGPNVDIYKNSVSQQNLLFANVQPQTISPYANMTGSSSNSIIVTATGSTTNVLLTASALPMSGAYTGIVQLQQGSITAFFINDSIPQPLTTNQSSIRFIFLGTEESFFALTGNETEALPSNSTAGVYSIQIQDGTTVIFNANLFDKDFERIVLTPGTYNFTILRGTTVVGTINNVVVVGAKSYSVFLFGVSNGVLIFQISEDTFAMTAFPPTQTQTPTTQTKPSTTGVATTGAITTGAITTGSSASTVTSGGRTVVIITGVNRPNIPSSAGRVDVAIFGVVCAVLFALFH